MIFHLNLLGYMHMLSFKDTIIRNMPASFNLLKTRFFLQVFLSGNLKKVTIPSEIIHNYYILPLLALYPVIIDFSYTCATAQQYSIKLVPMEVKTRQARFYCLGEFFSSFSEHNFNRRRSIYVISGLCGVKLI